jgi:hypothetical protein
MIYGCTHVPQQLEDHRWSKLTPFDRNAICTITGDISGNDRRFEFRSRRRVKRNFDSGQQPKVAFCSYQSAADAHVGQSTALQQSEARHYQSDWDINRYSRTPPMFHAKIIS